MIVYPHIFAAWISWNPSRFAFTVPFIERDVAWYGIFFALGFILGFLLIIPIFRQKLLEKKQILERDIASWPFLIQELKNDENATLFSKFSENNQLIIRQLRPEEEPSSSLKEEILDVFKWVMTHSKPSFSRTQIENLFPQGIRKTKDLALFLTDRITWFVVAGTIIGARLGHVFLYDWPRYQNDPLGIIKVWEGGLASHGGTVGIMLALFLYLKMIHKKFPEFTFVDLLDILCIPTAMAAIWIRIGNFFNQEIIGPVTDVPWAVIFEQPYDGSAPLPRHPAQLYEAFAYLFTFIFLYCFWRTKKETLKRGSLVGLFMIFVFGSRFIIEFFKMPQSLMIDESLFSTGQYLSIPFILLGLYFLFLPKSLTSVKVS